MYVMCNTFYFLTLVHFPPGFYSKLYFLGEELQGSLGLYPMLGSQMTDFYGVFICLNILWLDVYRRFQIYYRFLDIFLGHLLRHRASLPLYYSRHDYYRR